MFCYKCGTENSDEFKFCSSCGVSLTGAGGESNQKNERKSFFAIGLLSGIVIIALVFVGYIIGSGSSRKPSKPALNSETGENVVDKASSQEKDDKYNIKDDEDEINKELQEGFINLIKQRPVHGRDTTIGEYLENEVAIMKVKGIVSASWSARWLPGRDVIFIDFMAAGSSDIKEYSWTMNLKNAPILPKSNLAKELEYGSKAP